MSDKGSIVIRAKCVETAFDSPHSMQYFTGSEVEFTVTSTDHKYSGTARNFTTNTVGPFSRQLFYLKTVGGRRWVFDFDRANSSNTALRLFFCKECGQPFDRLSDIGTHSNSTGHNEAKKEVVKAKQISEDEEEERLLAERRAAEEAEEAKLKHREWVDEAKEAQKVGA